MIFFSIDKGASYGSMLPPGLIPAQREDVHFLMLQDPKIFVPAVVSVLSIILTIATIVTCIRKSKKHVYIFLFKKLHLETYI